MPADLLTPREAAQILRIDRRTVLKYARQGRLPIAYQLSKQRDGKPGTTLFTKAAVDRLAAELTKAEPAA